jgi:hypothetical protein
MARPKAAEIVTTGYITGYSVNANEIPKLPVVELLDRFEIAFCLGLAESCGANAVQ